jgi:hypothetical protein
MVENMNSMYFISKAKPISKAIMTMMRNAFCLSIPFTIIILSLPPIKYQEVIFIKAYVVTNILGVFAFDKNGKVVAYKLFPKKPEEIVERLKRSRSEEIIEEERTVLNKLRLSGYKEVIWDKQAKDGFIACVYDPDHRGKEIAKEGFRKLAMDTRFVTTQAELNEILTKVNTLLTKEEVSKIRNDKVLMQVVNVFA